MLMGLADAATAGPPQATKQSRAAGQAAPTLEEMQVAGLLLTFATAEQQQQPHPGTATADVAGARGQAVPAMEGGAGAAAQPEAMQLNEHGAAPSAPAPAQAMGRGQSSLKRPRQATEAVTGGMAVITAEARLRPSKRHRAGG